AGAGGGRAGLLPDGVEVILPFGGDARRLPGSGPVDRPPGANGATQAVEAWDDDLPGTAPARHAGRGFPGGRGPWPTLVEDRQARYDARCHAEQPPCCTGARQAGTALTSTN